MGNTKTYSEIKSEQIVNYYLFHKKIESIINKGKIPFIDNINQILKIYIINPNWINNWKLYTNYNRVKTELDKIVETNEENLLTKLKEKCQDLTNEGMINNSINYKPDVENHLEFGEIILELDFLKNEVFDYLIDYNTYDSFFSDISIFKIFRHETRKIKGIINDRMFILMLDNKKKIKFIYKGEIENENNLIQLTAKFSNLTKYESFCNELKNNNSNNIISIFNNEKIGYYKETTIGNNNYVLINETLKIKYILKKNNLNNIRFENNNNSEFVRLNKIKHPPYFNSVIQNLININPLTKYLLNKSNYNIINNNLNLCYFTCLYCQILSELCTNKRNKSYSLKDFDKVIYLRDSKFKFNKSSIPGDLIEFILETIKMEFYQFYLNISNNSQININNNIISKIFLSKELTKTECQNCKNKKNDYSDSLLLHFYLDVIYNEYINTENINMDENGKAFIKLELCFKHFSEPLILNSDSGYFCKKCNKVTNCILKKEYFYFPHILIIVINKDLNNNYILSFQEELNLKDFVNDKSKNKNYDYKLRGIIYHNKESYYAFCKHRISNKWYKCKDKDINLCSEIAEVLEQNPDVLIYESLNENFEDLINLETQIISGNLTRNSNLSSNPISQYNNFGGFIFSNFFNNNTNNIFVNQNMNMNNIQNNNIQNNNIQNNNIQNNIIQNNNIQNINIQNNNIQNNNIQNNNIQNNIIQNNNIYNTNIKNNNINNTNINNNIFNANKFNDKAFKEMMNPNSLFNKNQNINNNEANFVKDNNKNEKNEYNLIEGNINLENKENRISTAQNELFEKMKMKMGVNNFNK